MYQVQDVMNVNVLTIPADVTVEEVIRCFIKNHISGMPVVDKEGYLVGIISEFALLETLYAPKMREMLVRDMMTRDVLTVSPTTLLSDAISLIVVHRIRRLPVVDNGKIVGIVSRRDMLNYILEAGDKLEDFFVELKACVCSP